MGEAQSFLRLVFPSIRQFAQILKCFVGVGGEVVFSADQSGVGFRSMSPTGAWMVESWLPRAAFKEYLCDASLEFTLEWERLLEALSSVGEGWFTLLVHGSSAEPRLEAGFAEGKTEVALHKPSATLPQLKLEFEVESLVPLRVLREFVRQCVKGGHGEATIVFEDSKLEVRVDGLAKRLPTLKITSRVGRAHSTYDLGILRGAVCVPLQAKAVELCFSTTRPLQLHYTIPILYAQGAASIRCYVAPIQP